LLTKKVNLIITFIIAIYKNKKIDNKYILYIFYSHRNYTIKVIPYHLYTMHIIVILSQYQKILQCHQYFQMLPALPIWQIMIMMMITIIAF